MNDLKDLNRDQILEITNSDVWVSFRYAGTRLHVERTDDDTIIKKEGGDIISIYDMLISDLYYDAISILKDNKKLLPTGTYTMVYNAKTGWLLTEGIIEDHEFIKDNLRFTTSDTYHTKLKEDIVKSCLLKHTRKVFDSLRAELNPDDISSIILRTPGGETCKIMNHAIKPKKSVPTDLYNLTVIDVIKSIDVAQISKLDVPISGNYISRYVSIINHLFLQYLQFSKFNLPEMDYGYPAYMKVNVQRKLRSGMLSTEISDVISKEPKLYGTYMLMLMLFTKSLLKSNPYVVQSTKDKHLGIYNAIHEICQYGVMGMSLPTFSEFVDA